jgi:hypothetical protein
MNDVQVAWLLFMQLSHADTRQNDSWWSMHREEQGSRRVRSARHARIIRKISLRLFDDFASGRRAMRARRDTHNLVYGLEQAFKDAAFACA